MNTLSEQVVDKLNIFLKVVLKLGDEVHIKPNVELVEQIGLDSIEAFDAVAMLHDVLGVLIPHDFKPTAVATLESLAEYLIQTFGVETAQRFLDLDLAELSPAVPEPL